MTLLALDLSTAQGSIAVVRGEEVLFQAAFQSERSHNAQVFAPLREALSAAGSGLAGIVVGNGPGSYTGVRIAIAAAQGIALSRGVWCVGWSSLTAPDSHGGPNYRILGDARRQSFYLAEVRDGALLPEIETVSADVARERVSSSEVWLTFDTKTPLDLPHVRQVKPCAVSLAQRVASAPAPLLEQAKQEPLVPHYLAEAFITVSKKRPPARTA